jgi:ribosomal protein L40E
MGKFPEASARLLDNLFVCRRCKRKVRATNLKVLQGSVTCRKCSSTRLRPVRKK